jgi:TonB family protein
LPDGDPVRIKGRVVEAESGEALPGVSVLWKGHTTGTITDMNGDFILDLPDKNPVLTYSFVGFETATTKGAGTFTVKMERKTFQITEQVTGVVIRSASEGGGPAGEPLYVVDGEHRAGLDEIDTEDIISISVLKDESATELYGPGAKNGVVIVSTKKGWSKNKVSGEDTPGSKEVFYIVEDMPKFQGNDHNTCLKYVQEHLEYPQEAKARGLQGIVHVLFVVDARGKVTNARVKRGVDPLLDKAALKAVNSMPDWTPGRQRNKPVAVQFEIPVEFKQ